MTLPAVCVWARNNQPKAWASNYLQMSKILSQGTGIKTTPNGASKEIFGGVKSRRSKTRQGPTTDRGRGWGAGWQGRSERATTWTEPADLHCPSEAGARDALRVPRATNLRILNETSDQYLG